jgi:hypothetical protein
LASAVPVCLVSARREQIPVGLVVPRTMVEPAVPATTVTQMAVPAPAALLVS